MTPFISIYPLPGCTTYTSTVIDKAVNVLSIYLPDHCLSFHHKFSEVGCLFYTD
jgi:hypothetical protein